MRCKSVPFVVLLRFQHLVLTKQHTSTFYNRANIRTSHDFFNLVDTRALVWESLSYAYFRKLCSRGNQTAFHDNRKKLQNY